MDRVRLGIIGCGVIGQAHLRAAAGSQRVVITAVADLNGEAAKKAAADLPDARVHTRGEDLIADPSVDAVVLALPTCARHDLAMATLDAGKHLLLEKPPGMHAGELDALAALQGDRVVACASSRFRHYASARAAADFLADDPLGPIRHVRFRGIGPAGPPPEKAPPVWRLSRSLNGGGILVNWGIYDLDYLLGLLQFRLQPSRVLARAWPVAADLADRAAPGSDAETHLVGLVLCHGGEAISLERAEFAATARDEAWQIIGERGALRLQMTPGEGKQLVHDHVDPARGLQSQTIWEGDQTHTTVHDGPVHDFAEAILDRRPPLTSLKQATMLQRLIDALYLSADRQGEVTLDA